MFRRSLIFVALLALAPLRPLFAADLQALIADAAKDPAHIPALVTQGSAEVARLCASDPKKAAELGDTLEPFCKRLFFSSETIPAPSCSASPRTSS